MQNTSNDSETNKTKQKWEMFRTGERDSRRIGNVKVIIISI